MPWHLPVGGGGVGLENKAKWTRGVFECQARTCSRIILRTSLLHLCAYVAWTTLAYAVRTYFNVPFHAIIIHQCRLLCLDWGSWLLASTERIAYKKEHNTHTVKRMCRAAMDPRSLSAMPPSSNGQRQTRVRRKHTEVHTRCVGSLALSLDW
jgi:hypothetical protein